MNRREAASVLDLLHFLDGSQVADPEHLMLDIGVLWEAAKDVPQSGSLPLDMDVIEATLAEVAQRFSDGGDWLDGFDEPAQYTTDVDTRGAL